jgi:uncharacterized membrane protein YdjX (TVP38/TMEM64 family)
MDPLHAAPPPASPPSVAGPWRWLAPALLLVLMAAAYALGLHRYLSLDTLAEHRDALRGFAADHLLLAVLVFFAGYAAAVGLSVPGAVILTVTAGFLFGWLLGGLVAVAAATAGASMVFLVARSSFGDVLARRAGPALTRLKDGFARDAFHYLLFLRLVPLFPFWLVNLAPALANVKLRTFVAATAVGIIPGTFAFAFVGEGLDSVLAVQADWKACVSAPSTRVCPDEPTLSALITPQLLLAFSALGLVALLPVALRRGFAKWKVEE